MTEQAGVAIVAFVGGFLAYQIGYWVASQHTKRAQADTEAVRTQMEVAVKLAHQAESENLAEIARLERLVSQRDEELAEMQGEINARG